MSDVFSIIIGATPDDKAEAEALVNDFLENPKLRKNKNGEIRKGKDNFLREICIVDYETLGHSGQMVPQGPGHDFDWQKVCIFRGYFELFIPVF